jgi:DNA ligase (NAD+)
MLQVGDIQDIDEYVVRGELILSKANYEKIKIGKKGARQMVCGATCLKSFTQERTDEIALIEFVAYEVIVPRGLSPSEQFALLQRSSFSVAESAVESDVSIDTLGTILTERRQVSKYEVDGLIVNHDAAHPRVVGKNPDHAFAFKMAFADQASVTKVVAVNWDASKDGFLKPTVNFEPVNIGGVIIRYATGFNASFIQTHGLGPGAFIEVILSGDVIPFIKEVKMSAPEGPSMPTAEWHWNDTHVDAVLNCVSGNADVEKKALLHFANTLNIDFCGESTIARLHDAGITTIPKLLALTNEFLVRSVKGFKDASACKLISAIAHATTKTTLTQWAVGSGIFGRGVGNRRVEAAFTVVPDSLDGNVDLVSSLMALGGWSVASAECFVKALPEFKAFIVSIGIKPPPKDAVVSCASSRSSIGSLEKCVILFTGFHPKDLEADVVKNGGKLVDAWSKNVTHLVIKDSTISNEKTKKAAASGVVVLTADQFRSLLTTTHSSSSNM